MYFRGIGLSLWRASNSLEWNEINVLQLSNAFYRSFHMCGSRGTTSRPAVLSRLNGAGTFRSVVPGSIWICRRPCRRVTANFIAIACAYVHNTRETPQVKRPVIIARAPTKTEYFNLEFGTG